MVELTCLVHRLAHRSSPSARGEKHKQAATKSLIRAVSTLTVLGVLFAAGGALGDITYVYDPGGRLVAVTDASGNRADLYLRPREPSSADYQLIVLADRRLFDQP
jgi:hypothetical protein